MIHANILGVIVTHNPDPAITSQLLVSLAPQIGATLIIDNASASFPEAEFYLANSQLRMIKNSDNLGLATAYNQGIAQAQAGAFDYIILFDQDSVPAPNMVDCLFTALQQSNQHHFTTAAAGPKYTDIKGQKRSPFVRIQDFHLERVDCPDDAIVEIDHLISSGTLIDLRAIDIVGSFVDELFIDCVDTEWCLRARHRKLKILGVGSAAMRHNIGETYLQVFNRQLPLHPTTRLHYQFRNQVWIIKQPWVSWRWRICDAIRCTKIFIVFSLFAPNRAGYFYAMLKGLRDGITSRMGKI